VDGQIKIVYSFGEMLRTEMPIAALVESALSPFEDCMNSIFDFVSINTDPVTKKLPEAQGVISADA